MHWTKKKAAAAITLLVLAGAAWFLHTEGEGVKQNFVDAIPDNPPGYGAGTVAVIALLTVREQDKDYAVPTVCKTDFAECAKELAWNKKIERACVGAVLDLKDATQKIRNEPSLVLGFNRVLAEWQARPTCSPFSSVMGLPVWDCYVYNTQIEFYGLPEGMVALEKCLNEMNAAPYAP